MNKSVELRLNRLLEFVCNFRNMNIEQYEVKWEVISILNNKLDEMVRRVVNLSISRIRSIKISMLDSKSECPKIQLDSISEFICLPNIRNIEVSGAYITSDENEMQKMYGENMNMNINMNMNMNSNSMEMQREKFRRAIQGNYSLRSFKYYPFGIYSYQHPTISSHKEILTWQILFQSFNHHPNIQNIQIHQMYLQYSFSQISNLAASSSSLSTLLISPYWEEEQFIELSKHLSSNNKIRTISIPKIYSSVDPKNESLVQKYLLFLERIKSDTLENVEINDLMSIKYTKEQNVIRELLRRCPNLDNISLPLNILTKIRLSLSRGGARKVDINIDKMKWGSIKRLCEENPKIEDITLESDN